MAGLITALLSFEIQVIASSLVFGQGINSSSFRLLR
jgi:hypothetical protein